MKPILTIMTALFLFLPAACERPSVRDEVRALQNLQIENGIIRQRTVYPYHFLPDTAALNQLGTYDLQILAQYFERHSGKLNVLRGHAGNALYEARVGSAMQQLAGLGVQTDRLQVVDEFSAGDGMLSARVIIVLDIQKPQPPSMGGRDVSFTLPSAEADVPAMK